MNTRQKILQSLPEAYKISEKICFDGIDIYQPGIVFFGRRCLTKQNRPQWFVRTQTMAMAFYVALQSFDENWLSKIYSLCPKTSFF
ncbi:MAG TPA: hypothetical protein VG847_09860, partial [Chitinophagaceae bacterium]|nr:hypothetical protein [Chitinophagaceae bacterium]